MCGELDFLVPKFNVAAVPSLFVYNNNIIIYTFCKYWRCTLTLTHYVTNMDLGEDSDSRF